MRLVVFLKSGKKLRFDYDGAGAGKLQEEVTKMLAAVRDQKSGIFTLNYIGGKKVHIPIDNIDYVESD